MANFCPTVQDICLTRGDSPVMFFTVRDTDNAVVDITGYTFRMTVDPSPSPANADNNLFTVDGVVVDGPNGRVSLQPSTLNTNQTPRTYFYDIQMTTTTPSVRTIFAGKFEIRQDITKT